jgi:hypothetical protein
MTNSVVGAEGPAVSDTHNVSQDSRAMEIKLS